jgi:hypothetical protein
MGFRWRRLDVMRPNLTLIDAPFLPVVTVRVLRTGDSGVASQALQPRCAARIG